jgi:hypothetical protein
MNLIRIAFFSAALLALGVNSFAQSRARQTRREPQRQSAGLIEAQTRSAQAQADYYETEVSRLNAAPTPTPTKTISEAVRENPASAAVIIAAAITALVSLVVAAFTSFIGFLNYQVASKSRDDEKFGEALKLFGDRDNPALRLSAAGVLGEMARRKRHEFNEREPFSSLIFRGRPYRETALNQLFGGLPLEDNRVALLEIRRAIIKIIEDGRDFPLDVLGNNNGRLQVYVRRALADFFIAHGAKTVEAVTATLWDEIPKRIYKPEVFKYLKQADEELFSEVFRLSLLKHETITYSELSKKKQASFEGMLLAPYCLYLYVGIYEEALKASPELKTRKMRAPLFLVNANLEGVDLKDAKLEKAIMSGAKLAGANLRGADLSGAWLDGAELTGAQLCGVKFNDVNLKDVKWWKADFYKQPWGAALFKRHEVDEKLLRSLCPNGADGFTAPDDEVHPSVKVFLDSHKNGNGNGVKN